MEHYRVVLQKGFTFAGLQRGRSARERVGQHLKRTAHSRTFERGAGEPDPTILGHARADFLKSTFFELFWKGFKSFREFYRKNSTFFDHYRDF